MRINKFIFIVVVFTFILSVFYGETAVSPDAKKVLLLTSPSSYRDELLKAMKKKLAALSLNVSNDRMKNHSKYNPKDYDLVIIISGVETGNPYKEVPEFILKYNYPSNIIYFSALTIEENAFGKKLDKSKIDAVTAASENKNIEVISEKIIKKAMEKLNIKK